MKCSEAQSVLESPGSHILEILLSDLDLKLNLLTNIRHPSYYHVPVCFEQIQFLIMITCGRSFALHSVGAHSAQTSAHLNQGIQPSVTENCLGEKRSNNNGAGIPMKQKGTPSPPTMVMFVQYALFLSNHIVLARRDGIPASNFRSVYRSRRTS